VYTYLVEGIQQVGNQRGSRARIRQNLHQTKVAQVSNEPIGGRRRESQRVSPEIPLESHDTHGTHASPDHAKGRLAASETGVEETETGYHKHDHSGGDDDVGLVTGLVPFVQVLRP
jgi:hypothetical protein